MVSLFLGHVPCEADKWVNTFSTYGETPWMMVMIAIQSYLANKTLFACLNIPLFCKALCSL